MLEFIQSIKNTINQKIKRYKNTQALLQAVKNNDNDKFNELIWKWKYKTIELDINYNDWLSRSILKWAVINNNALMVHLLMSQVEIDFNDTSSFYNKVSLWSLKWSYYLSYTALIAIQLWSLILHSSSRVLSYVLDIGFYGAISAAALNIFKIIAAELTLETETPIQIAIRMGYTPIVVSLLKNNMHQVGMNLNNQICRAIYLATWYGHHDMVKKLVNHDYANSYVNDTDKEGRSSIMVAADLNREDIVKTLLKSKELIIKINYTGWSRLYSNKEAEYIHKIGVLSGNEPNFTICMNPEKYNANEIHEALKWATENQYLDCVIKLLRADRLNVSLIDEDLARSIDHIFSGSPIIQHEITCQHMVLACVHPQVYGTEISMTKRALSEAMYRGCSALVRSLLSKKTEANLFCNHNTFDLLKYSLVSSPEIAQMLLDDPRVHTRVMANKQKLMVQLWLYVNNVLSWTKYDLKKSMLELFVLPKNSRYMKALIKNAQISLWSIAFDKHKLMSVIWGCSKAVRLNFMENWKFLGKTLSDIGLSERTWGYFAQLKFNQFSRNIHSGIGYTLPQQQALYLIVSNAGIEHLEMERINPDQNMTNADNRTFAARGKHFADRIKPEIEPELKKKYGDDIIAAIEAVIRKAILEEAIINSNASLALLSTQQTLTEKEEKERDNCKALINFIEKVKSNEEKAYEKLLSGSDEELMNQATALLSNNENTTHMAWRAYDKFSKVGPIWLNLLVPQTSEQKIYSIREVIEGELTAKIGSELAREIIAYTYYSIIMRKSELNDAERANRITQFIARIAEIQRTNNNNNVEIDSPSCIVGIYSRVAKLWEMEISLAQAKNTKERCALALTPIVFNAFSNALKKCSTAQEKTDLYKALTDLRFETAEDYLQMTPNRNVTRNSDNSHNQQEQELELESLNQERKRLARIRYKFKESLGSEDRILAQINSQLRRDNLTLIENIEIIYLVNLLADIGGGWISASLTEEYLKHVPVVNEDMTENKIAAVVNPFKLHPNDYQRLPEVIIQKRLQKGPLWEILHLVLNNKQRGQLAEPLVNNVFALKDEKNIDDIIQITLLENQETLETDVKNTLKQLIEQHLPKQDRAATNDPVIDDGAGVAPRRYMTRYAKKQQNEKVMSFAKEETIYSPSKSLN